MTGGEIVKAFDAAIKAPLWFFFALAAASGIFLLNPGRLLSAQDLKAVTNLVGPPGAWLVVFASLFLSSACSRAWPALRAAISACWALVGLLGLRVRLSDKERALLWLFEAEAADFMHFVDAEPSVRALRDRGLLHAELIGRNAEWGRYHLPLDLDRLRRKKPGRFRWIFRSSAEAQQSAKQNMLEGMRHARQLARA